LHPDEVIITVMRRRLSLVLLVLALLTLSLVLGYGLSQPRLRDVSPADGSIDVPATAPLRLFFSRPLQTDSVAKNLTITPEIPGVFAWQGNILSFTPNAPWPAGETVQVRLAAGARAFGFWSLPVRQGRSWSFTVRQPRLAYLYPSDGPANIFLLNLASGERQPLTNSLSGVQDYSLGPDDTTIYYSLRTASGGSEIYRLALSTQGVEEETQAMRPSPPQPELVLACPDASCRLASVSPAGNYLAYERTALPGTGQADFPQVWIMPLVSSGDSNGAAPPATPTLVGDSAHQTIGPSWSREGLLAYYDSTSSEYVIFDPQRGQLARFTNKTAQPGVWNPNGAEYAAAEINFLDPGTTSGLVDLERLADSHLLLYDWHTGKTQDLTAIEGIEDAVPAFSPDGSQLAFARKYLDTQHWTPGRQLWLMRLSDHQAHPLTNDPLYNHFDIAWSPSGRWLAYVRFNQSLMTEPPEVWWIDPLTGETAPAALGGYAPLWIP
jgi:Tol biopolymer transport system component